MHKYPYLVNIIVSTVLITVGAFGYWFSYTFNWPWVFAATVGIIFLTLTPYVRRKNHLVLHFVVGLSVLTFLTGVFMVIGTMARHYPHQHPVLNQLISYAVMALAGFFAAAMYIWHLRYTKALRDDLDHLRHRTRHTSGTEWNDWKLPNDIV